MTAREQDEPFPSRLQAIYSEQVAGMRDGLLAVNRNVLRYIAEGRDRGEQIDAAIKQLGVCADELRQIKAWQRWFSFGAVGMFVMIGLLMAGVIALLIKVF